MRAPTRTGRSILRPGAFLLALAAWGLLAPAEAKAGCRHPGVSASGAMAWLDALDQLDRADEGPRPVPAPSPRPCDGPSCSEREAPPAPAPVSTAHDPGQRWALGETPRPDADAGSEFAPADGSRPRPIRIPLAIFRPPPAPRALATA